MKVFTILNPEKVTNIYMVTDNKHKYGVIIDPGSFSIDIYKTIKNIGADIRKILLTQNIDINTVGIALLKKIFDVDIFANSDKINHYTVNKIKEGDVIEEGELKFKVFETPVSSYDSVSLMIDNSLFVGNTIQAGTLWRIKKETKTTNFESEIIKRYFIHLPDDTIIFPGKGPISTIKLEKEYNPYFKDLN